MDILEKIIKEEIKKQFADAPKMGDIKPTDQADKDRPGMKNRPDNGMTINPHHIMMWVNETADKAFVPAIKDFCKYTKNKLDIKEPISIDLINDKENAKDLFGYTGFYSPSEKKVVVFCTNRSFSDICRSISHELVHAKQHIDGKFPEGQQLEEDYAQTNSMMRKLEAEAYLKGDLIFRDFKDMCKKKRKTMLDEFSAVGGGGVVGFAGAPIGMDMAPVHAAMWSGNTPQTKSKKSRKKKKKSK